MRANRTDGLETRRKLLDAAAALFAEKGFRDATTAELCRRAGANIAAVNYHFGGKEALYAEAWRHAFERSIEVYPPDGGAAAGAPAEERLRGHIRALVRRFMDPGSRDLDIVAREMADPTGLLVDVMRQCLEPLRRMHLAIVRELLGPAAAERDVQLCERSIHAQCFGVPLHERRRRAASGALLRGGPPKLDIDADALADHVARFSLAGVREVRRNAARRAGKQED